MVFVIIVSRMFEIREGFQLAIILILSDYLLAGKLSHVMRSLCFLLTLLYQELFMLFHDTFAFSNDLSLLFEAALERLDLTLERLQGFLPTHQLIDPLQLARELLGKEVIEAEVALADCLGMREGLVAGGQRVGVGRCLLCEL